MRCQRLSVQGCAVRRYGDAHAAGAADHWCAPELRVLACARQFIPALCRAYRPLGPLGQEPDLEEAYQLHAVAQHRH